MRRKNLDEANTLIFVPGFPYNSDRKCPRGYRHRVVIGIGGNVGDVLRRFRRLLQYWKRCNDAVRIVATSPVLKNPPFGFADQADFYNAIVVVCTPLSPRALLRFLLHTEKRFGRKRTFKNAPRTLDLDMIFYDNRKIAHKTLTVPHPHWRERDSVRIPLSYMERSHYDTRNLYGIDAYRGV